MSRTDVALVILALSLLLSSVLWALIFLVEGLFGTQAWISVSYESSWSGAILAMAYASIVLLALAPLVFFYGRYDLSRNHPRFVSLGVVLVYVTLFAFAPVSYYLPGWIYLTVPPLLLGFGILLLVWTPATKASRGLLIAGALTLPMYIGYVILCCPVIATLLSLRKTEQERGVQRRKEMEDWLTGVDSGTPSPPDETH